MKQGTMNILFFVLKTKLLKNGEAPVLMRITINGSYDDARIQRSVPLNLWNAAKGCSKGRDRASIALNTYIAELHARALEKHKELVLEQALITPKLILKRVFGKDIEMRTLLGTMQDGIKEMETLAGIDYSPVTINRYKNVVKKLQQLIPSYYGKEDITFHELTPEFIRAFDIYLKTEGGLCRNTIVRYMKCFKKFTNMALAKEWMRKNPFYGYKMEQDETDPVFLTYDELQAVMKKKFTIPRLELVRDIFVFACFTGLAFSDVATLSGENLVQDNLGDWWIRKGRVKLEHRRKASSISNIPLLPVPLGHIGEIQGTSDLRKERMLPACHVQPENEQLPQGNRRFLRHKEKSDHARCQAHFRDHRHARQQCTLAGRVRHARTCFHTHDAALCAGHEQQPERGDEQCEGTSGMVNMQPARH